MTDPSEGGGTESRVRGRVSGSHEGLREAQDLRFGVLRGRRVGRGRGRDGVDRESTRTQSRRKGPALKVKRKGRTNIIDGGRGGVGPL